MFVDHESAIYAFIRSSLLQEETGNTVSWLSVVVNYPIDTLHRSVTHNIEHST